MKIQRALLRCGVAAAIFVFGAGVTGTIGSGSFHATGAQAAVANQLPFMCFTTAHTFHQTFGPNSFFLNETQQGPTSFQESGSAATPTVTLPLYQGTANGHLVYYVITDASTRAVASSLGVNYTPKLANAKNTSAVQHALWNSPTALHVPVDVDFSPTHVLVAGPKGFPPAQAAPGAVGRTGYSPLVQMPNGVVLNAPQVGDGTTIDASNKAHWADKVAYFNPVTHTVFYDETNGCYENQSVHYVSTDSSDAGAAAIEDVTYAPALNNVPSPDCGTNDVNQTPPFIAPGCARESLIAFTNGQTGRGNIQRQGLNAAILDAESPLNILEDVPNAGGQFNYSPMWDIHLVQWNASVPLVNRVRQTSFVQAAALVGSQAQSITPGGLSNTLTATGFIVDCPLIAMYANF